MSNKTKVMVMDCVGTENENYAYDITFKNLGLDTEKYVISRSNDTAWSKDCRGEKLYTLKDNGNGVVIKSHDGSKIELDYSEIDELKTLLDFYEKHSPGIKCDKEFYLKEKI